MLVPKLAVIVFELTIFEGMALSLSVCTNCLVKSVDQSLALVACQSIFLEQAIELGKSFPLF